MASAEDVRKEFAVRDEKVRAEKKAAQEIKDNDRAMKMQVSRASKHRAVEQNVVMMAANEAESENNSENLKLGTYNRKTHKNNEFFTKYPCDMIFEGIQ